MGVRFRGTVALLLTLAVLGPASRAVATSGATPVSVFPVPGTRFAAPETTLSFRGLPAGTHPAVQVTGTLSGAHPGRWVEHSDRAGASFVPARPFTPGETVTVTTSRPVVGVGRTYRFTVAVPPPPGPPLTAATLAADRAARAGAAGAVPPRATAVTPRATAVTPRATAAAPPSWRFQSRPDLSPPPLQVTTSAAGQAPGVFLAAPIMQTASSQLGAYIYDSAGQPVWFNPDPQTVGNLTRITYLGQDALAWFDDTKPGPGGVGTFAGVWRVVDTGYRPIGTISAGNGMFADLHELTVSGTNALVLVYHPVTMDLSKYGGSTKATVLEAVIQQIDLPTGQVTWEWHSLDHVPVTDTFVSLKTAVVDYMHANAVSYDPTDQSLILSGRQTSAVYKIRIAPGTSLDGTIAWQLGGRHSTFAFVSDPGNGPSWQHDARSLGLDANGKEVISAFDNGNGRSPQYSRGVQWEIDPTATPPTATLVKQWLHSPTIYGSATGNSRALSNNDQLISWGFAGVATEYTPTGGVDFEDYFLNHNVTYRTYRTDWHATPVRAPDVAVRRVFGVVTAFASWNGATDVTGWQLLGGSSSGSLAPLATVPRTGFETTVTAAAAKTDSVFAVRALGTAGAPLGTSRSVTDGYQVDDAVLPTRGPTGDLQADGLVAPAWTGPVSYGGAVGSRPAAAVLSDGHLMLAASGPNHALWVRVSTPTGPTAWQNLDGVLSAGPALAPMPNAQVEAVVCGSDRAVYATRIDEDGSRRPFQRLGGSCAAGAPSVARANDGTILVATIGSGGHPEVILDRPRTGWSSWRGLTGIGTVAVGAAPVPRVDQVMVAVRSSSGAVDVRTTGPASWVGAGWANIGGVLPAGAPVWVAASVRTGTVHVVALGTDGLYHERVFTVSTRSWGPWRKIA